MRLLLIATLPLVIALPSASRAQASTDSLWIAGTVVDTLGRPISDAAVLLQPDGLTTRTDGQGFFSLRVAAGPATLVVRHIGYGALQSEINLQGGVHRQFRIELSPLAQLLDAVVAEARRPYMPPGAPASLDDFYRRRAEGKGRTFTRDDIERLGSVRAAMAMVPGIRIVTDVFGNVVGLNVPRCVGVGVDISTGTDGDGMPTLTSTQRTMNSVAWFLDGLRTATPPNLRDDDVEAVEVYRGSSALPAEAIGDACAAVFIWTRREP